MWYLILVYLKIVLVLVQDWCKVCAKQTIGSEIILHAPMVPLGNEAEVEACFGSLGDSAHLDAR